MRIAIVGAGAVGSVIAGYLLERGGHEISLLARGSQLAAIKEHGLTLETRGRRLHSRPRASAAPADLGGQDLLFVTTKAHALPELAPRLAPMLGPETLVVFAQNGIPWWYFHGHPGPDAETPFETVDPGGVIWRVIGPQRALGCVIYLPAHIASPGVAHHDGVLRLVLGAPRAGDHAPALRAAAELLGDAGIETKLTDDIRKAVWAKLLLNTAAATLSVLTGGTLGQLRTGPGMAEIRARLMREALATARAWDVDLADEIDATLAAGGSASGHKASMLQDYEARRPLELDAIVKAVIDLARRRQVSVSTIETLWSTLMVKLAVEGYPGMASAS
ncbi:MAG: 2-dehydropantoate 2-reductase [Aliidongia sp.]